MGKKMLFCGLVLIGFSVACTDTYLAGLASFGSEGHVQCYSGGKLIYEGDSTGKLQTVSQSDGWEFRDKKTCKFVRVSGDCVIIN